MKKILFSVLGIIFFLAIGWYLVRPYFSDFSFSPSNRAPIVKLEVDDIKKISDKQVLDYWIDSSDRSIFYLDLNNTLYKRLPGNNTEEKEIHVFPGKDILSIQPSPQKEHLLFEQLTEDGSLFFFFSLKTKGLRQLPTGVSAATWNPSLKEKEIAYLMSPESDTSEKGILLFNIEKNIVSQLTQFSGFDLKLGWPSPEELFIFSRPSIESPGSLWKFDLEKSELSLLEKNQRGLSFFNNLLFINSSSTSLIDLKNGTSLDIKTLPKKCLVNKPSYYCAVPIDQNFENFPDDYYQRKVITNDELLLINESGEKSLILPEGEKFDVWKIKKAGKQLYFINRQDGNLYELALE